MHSARVSRSAIERASMDLRARPPLQRAHAATALFSVGATEGRCHSSACRDSLRGEKPRGKRLPGLAVVDWSLATVAVVAAAVAVVVAARPYSRAAPAAVSPGTTDSR